MSAKNYRLEVSVHEIQAHGILVNCGGCGRWKRLHCLKLFALALQTPVLH
jgi:hypothetical protein